MKRWVWKVTYDRQTAPVRLIQADGPDLIEPSAEWSFGTETHIISGPHVEDALATVREVADVGREFEDDDNGWVMIVAAVRTFQIARLVQVEN